MLVATAAKHTMKETQCMPAKKLIPPGTRFTRLVVVKRVENSKDGRASWLCACDCGKKSVVIGKSLRNGNTRSCGCLHREIISQKMKQRAEEMGKEWGLAKLRHGHRRGRHSSPTYESWCGIISRCGNEQRKDYHHYGGRGIKVCERWLTFDNFLADMGEKPTGMSIGRIDNNGNYEPSNCRWETHRQQMRNRRGNRIVTAFGKTGCLADFTEHFKVSYSAVLSRLRIGWSVERAFTEPLRHSLKRA
jgi:hypothetical protein